MPRIIYFDHILSSLLISPRSFKFSYSSSFIFLFYHFSLSKQTKPNMKTMTKIRRKIAKQTNTQKQNSIPQTMEHLLFWRASPGHWGCPDVRFLYGVTLPGRKWIFPNQQASIANKFLANSGNFCSPSFLRVQTLSHLSLYMTYACFQSLCICSYMSSSYV